MIDNADAGRVLAELGRISRTLVRAGKRSGEPSVAGTQYAFLQRLRETDARLSDLARALRVSMPVASRGIDALESDGFVARSADPKDARAALISITDAGRAWLRAQETHFVARFAATLDDWTADDAHAAAAMLARLGRSLEQITNIAPTRT